MASKTKPQLSVISAAPERTGPPPPSHLDEIGRQLWIGITDLYEWG
jgi:hypothetical protein